MKCLIGVWVLCSALCLGSFGVLLFEDRRLGVPVPYSVPLAFATMLLTTPGLLLIVKYAPSRQPAPDPIVRVSRPAETPARLVAEGLVLLDLSGSVAFGGGAA